MKSLMKSNVHYQVYQLFLYTRLLSTPGFTGILHGSQFGFREGRTPSHMHYSVLQTQNCLQDGKYVLGILIDFSKAFDAIDHQILPSILEKYSVRRLVHNDKIIQSYLLNRKQYVNFYDEMSE